VQIESEAARASAAACREQRRQADEAVTAGRIERPSPFKG